MTLIFDKTFTPTLDSLHRNLAAHHGHTIEAWLFNDAPTRRAAERACAQQGRRARFRSAYKPLLHFFLEDLEITTQSFSEITVIYPTHPAAAPNRFLLESYPLAALVGTTPLSFQAGSRNDGIYEVIVTHQGRTTRHHVFAPNRLHCDAVGQDHLSPTGWLRITDAAGDLLRDERLNTDFEQLFADTMRAVAAQDWGTEAPFFEELNITVTLPGCDQPLPGDYGDISLHEALHEDFYFALLEFFQVKSGHPPGGREGQPGQIVPDMRTGGHTLSVRVDTRPLSTDERGGADQKLEQATRPLTSAQIAKELAKIGGDLLTASSRTGRQVNARYHNGTDRPVMISGGQHANEVTGPIGALRAARTLARRDGAHFVISPLENPDGYALHQRLIVNHPHHMHHAARYTALGDDLEYRQSGDLLEKDIRKKAQDISTAQLHINLHGYPAHEWTRPLAGYVPRGFDMWTLPRGFFLILRHHTAWKTEAHNFITQVTQQLASVPDLLAFNQASIDLYRTHSGETGSELINGFPCWIDANDQQSVPLTLITEYPDETIYGDAFIAGHHAQMATVIAAYDTWQNLHVQSEHLSE